jgi:hypothetical protein
VSPLPRVRRPPDWSHWDMICIESEYRATRNDVAIVLESLAGGLRRGRVAVGTRSAAVGAELNVDAELSPSTGVLRITVDLGESGKG